MKYDVVLAPCGNIQTYNVSQRPPKQLNISEDLAIPGISNLASD